MSNRVVHMTGWKSIAFFSGFVGILGAFLYPIIVYPLTHTEEYRKIQEKNREGINQESVQPGGMKVWTDPFEKKQ